MRTLLLSALLVIGLTASVQAQDALSMTPEEVYEMTRQQGDQMLFVDVRDPVEIMFIGFTDSVDRNIPFQLVDRHSWNGKKGVFTMNINENFASEVDEALAEKGLDRDSLIVTMCRSGSARGKSSAEYLLERGFTNVKYVDNGFQGGTVKEGEKKGFRVKNGWQNSGLPWSPKANPEKLYRP